MIITFFSFALEHLVNRLNIIIHYSKKNEYAALKLKLIKNTELRSKDEI